MTLNRILPVLAILAVPLLVGADDAAKSKARARAALALASADAPPVMADPPLIAARAAAKAALNKCGDACPCSPCDCEPGTCDCCKAEKIKPMPPATPPEIVAEKPKPERLAYAELTKAVAKLKPGETVTLYVGQKSSPAATGRIIELSDSIPGEEQRIGVWKCWVENGEAKMASAQPAKGGVRVVVDGRYLDRYADGSLYWCAACNRGK